MAGQPDELAPRLRPWALAALLRERAEDGRYFAYVVELEHDDMFDTYRATAAEDVIWFYEQEHVPAT